jgi:hypothetical protein
MECEVFKFNKTLMPKENAVESGFTVPRSWNVYDDHNDTSNCNNTDDNSIQFLLFIYMQT